MSRITVKKLIEILQTFDPALEVWTSEDTGYFPMEYEPVEETLEDFNISFKEYELDIGKKIIKI